MRRREEARASSDVELAEETMDKRGVCDRPGCFQGPCAAVSSFFSAWQSTPGGEGC